MRSITVTTTALCLIAPARLAATNCLTDWDAVQTKNRMIAEGASFFGASLEEVRLAKMESLEWMQSKIEGSCVKEITATLPVEFELVRAVGTSKACILGVQVTEVQKVLSSGQSNSYHYSDTTYSSACFQFP